MGKRKVKNSKQDPKNAPANNKKSKKNKNKTLSSLMKNTNTDNIQLLEAELQHLQDEALSIHNKEIESAKLSYNELISSIEQSDIILQVLDARDPISCRLEEAEKLAKEKGKTLIHVLNKIDLIPKEVAIDWLGEFTQTFGPTIAISATSQEAASALINETISQVSQSPQKVAVIGIKGVGKSTICSLNQILIEVQSYNFVTSTIDSSLIGAIEYLGDLSDFALEIISRSQDESIFDLLGIEPQEDENDVLKEYSKAQNKTLRKATKEFVNNILTNAQPFYAVPEDMPATNMSDNQLAIINVLKSNETGDNAIHIVRGDPLVVNTALLEASSTK
ncbi:hypothetical protein TRFO_12672 [Tritrichomonas foetus]|uniref:Uncharacterized protein n=1 Tax=Tritrichomonas foetus TaxID=1144522 RepID=A0A1J4L0V1_9EUKA|nr:hypothetical protein TRFO_12672 [Tritrichomonas foetus]|eukprot:OHT17143.1 hypothetical protein TRFO_12672 [Tritrichomonas foetus]